MTPEQRAEFDTLQNGTPDLERSMRAAQLAVDGEEADARDKAKTTKPQDPEMRERIELRKRATARDFFMARTRGKPLTGASAELHEAAGFEDGTIPLELWDIPAEDRAGAEVRVTPAPGTVGVNLDVLRPEVFAPSVVDKLGVEMPMVPSGTYATGTISTALDAGAVAKGADVPETDGAFTVQTTTPHRIGGSLNLSVEDIGGCRRGEFRIPLAATH